MPQDLQLKIALYGFFKGDEPGSFKVDRILPNEVGTEVNPVEPLRDRIKALVAILILQSTKKKSLEIEHLLAEPDSLIAVKDDGTLIDIDKPLKEAGLSQDPVVHVLLNERKYPPQIAAKLMAFPLAEMRRKRVFVGHGHSRQWLEVKVFLEERLKLHTDEFNRESIAGVPVPLRLQKMLDEARAALLIMTAEDEHKDGSVHARENVVHEVGLFQGRLGFQKAVVVLEESCASFSNIAGLGQIRFPQGRISACFEEIRRFLEREGII